jgi:ribosomal protein S18 acetylase RimI-like enzyme
MGTPHKASRERFYARIPPGSLLRLKVRKAESSDKKPLMSFIKDVWGGHDYIPHVWDEWIRDKSARMYVIEADGRPIALNRVRFLGDGSAWFEGVRVHPDYRRMGLASMLGDNAMKVARENGATVFRLTSGSRNKASQGQVAKMGFVEVARFSVYEPLKTREFRSDNGVRIAKRGDLESVMNLMKSSAEYRLGRGALWDGFAEMSLTPTVVKNAIDENTVYLCGDAVAVRRLGREGKEIWNQIGYISGDPQPALKLVDAIFAMKGRFDWRFVMVPQGSPLIGALKRQGLRRSFSNVLFERSAAKG